MIYDEIWDDERQEYVSSRKIGKPLGPNAPHYPNKSERVLLTQMMQKSGMTEEQVRAIKSNRVKLAQARKAPTLGRPWLGPDSRANFELKRAKRKRAKSLGVQVWEL
jgi:hypothetical protein